MIVEREVNGAMARVETFDDGISRLDADQILAGSTYPVIPYLGDVRVVLDIGANVGATSVFLSCHYPDARIQAFEPAASTYALLARNVRDRANVHPHNVGILDRDGTAELFHGAFGPGQASIHREQQVRDESETIELRSISGWLHDADLGAIDILKVDTEGCEIPILEDLGERVHEPKVIYLECHRNEDWRTIDQRLSISHELVVAKIFFETSEVTYLRRDLVPQVRQGSEEATSESAGGQSWANHLGR